uniref:Uncharacterized protein n=1 Tax=Anguilla anguilla TaxID=7936 RepID=A0A0E9R7A1_ANGAN
MLWKCTVVLVRIDEELQRFLQFLNSKAATILVRYQKYEHTGTEPLVHTIQCVISNSLHAFRAGIPCQ